MDSFPKWRERGLIDRLNRVLFQFLDIHHIDPRASKITDLWKSSAVTYRADVALIQAANKSSSLILSGMIPNQALPSDSVASSR